MIEDFRGPAADWVNEELAMRPNAVVRGIILNAYWSAGTPDDERWAVARLERLDEVEAPDKNEAPYSFWLGREAA